MDTKRVAELAGIPEEQVQYLWDGSKDRLEEDEFLAIVNALLDADTRAGSK